MDNIRSALGRIESIRSTLGIATPPPAQESTASPTQFADTLARAGYARSVGAPLINSPAAWGSQALTPIAGRRQTGAPPGLEAYQNGAIPLEMLGRVPGTGEALWAPAAAAFNHMRHDASLAGVQLPIIDAYRPLEDQHRLAGELGLYSEGGLAAQPGTSQHGWGRAVDLELDGRALSWMRANAWKYGFIEPVPRESWHWEFHPAG